MIEKICILGLFVMISWTSQAQQSSIKPIKVDGVAAVIGENIVLDSDLTKFKKDLEQRQEGVTKRTDCELLEDIMSQKLMAHQAIQDSILVSDAEIFSQVEQSLSYFESQLGSMEKTVEFFGFNDEDDLREELYRVQQESLLVQQMQASIVSDVKVTPEEVRLYFKSLEEQDAVPEFSSEVELAQILIKVEPSQASIDETLDRLNTIRQDVLNGASFRMRAILNSDDPAVSQNGGLYEVERESQFVKEFKEAAFSLEKGEISEPFESDFGYHILMVEDIKGQKISARHILLQPKVSTEDRSSAKSRLEGIRTDILLDKITFEEAVSEYSEDENTVLSKGVLINPQTQDSKFDLTRMDPTLYARITNLKKGEMTEVFYDETREGEKFFKIILMKDRIPSHKADLKGDYVKIQRLALQKKQEELMDNWTKDALMDTYIKLSNDTKKCSFKYNWSKS